MPARTIQRCCLKWLVLVRTTLLVLVLTTLVADVDPQSLLKQAEADLDAGRYPSAIKTSEQAAQLFQKSNDARSRARALTDAGLAQTYSGEYGAAIRNFDEALKIARLNHEFGAEVARLNDLGNALFRAAMSMR